MMNTAIEPKILTRREPIGSKLLKVLRHPVRCQRTKLICDVEADVVSFLEVNEFGRPGGFVHEPLAFRGRDQLISATKHHEHRTGDLACETIQVEALRGLQAFFICLCTSPLVEHLSEMIPRPNEIQ